MTNDKYSLEDLNNLAPGSGDKIHNLLEGINNRNYQKTMVDIRMCLERQELGERDVLVEKGLASGLTVEEALSKVPHNFKMQNRLNG